MIECRFFKVVKILDNCQLISMMISNDIITFNQYFYWLILHFIMQNKHTGIYMGDSAMPLAETVGINKNKI